MSRLTGDQIPWRYGSAEIEREQEHDCWESVHTVECQHCGLCYAVLADGEEPAACPYCEIDES